ncbi:hypothetical protein M409DRAFT_19501 [Zasmidium cellare ATCC 36951]|uniref:NAD dependent epimerase/dehydratase n=1 Tax=Zasmidium cellare ATCC 36951 TaxID=1080233 RepID=A0A6A6CZ94_ZASCE|nr:uncharacterized protein M409DRAFT_19501 [Zasmidium cellare ATCC 36951]KAF2170686.1 hypothetical protein M409DRAFT_19501 [Zasmidium cellare ATCC 36951]
MTMNEKKPTEYQGLQVIGGGLPRTATTSLHNALETLGYAPCHNFRMHIIGDTLPYTHTRTWQRLFDPQTPKSTRRALLHNLYTSTAAPAAVDCPTCYFVDDLIEMYPDAKVVLSIRSSPSAWKTSFAATIGRVATPSMKFATFFFPGMTFGVIPLLTRMDELSQRRYGCAWGEEAAYERHNEWVKRVVPEERLLVFEPKMGYEVLCEFLGVEAPRDGEGRVSGFPRVNESKGFERALGVFAWVGYGSWVLVIGVVVGVVRRFM